MVDQHDSTAPTRPSEARAEIGCSGLARAGTSMSHDCTGGTGLRDARPAREDSIQRTPESFRAESAARALRPLRKSRSALSAEFDGVMSRLGKTNGAIAAACGVNEKTVRQWRGRDLMPGEVARPIPSDMLVHLPEDLFGEMYAALRGLRVVERHEARMAAVNRAVSR